MTPVTLEEAAPKYEPHELGNLFPPMGEQEFKTLRFSIYEEGLKEAITLYEGKILDGNNRYRACLLEGKESRFEQFPEGEDPLMFILSRNLARRNLSTSQRAFIASEIEDRMKKQAVERAKMGGDAKAKNLLEANLPQAEVVENQQREPQTRDKVAEIMGVSSASVATASRVRREDPEEAEKVKTGKKTVNAAAKAVLAKKDAKARKEDEFAKAIEKIRPVYGNELTDAIRDGKRLKPKEVIELSGLAKEDMQRIKPLIANGWKLKAAIGYKVQSITEAHTIRQLLDRAQAQGGYFTLEITTSTDENRQGWIIQVDLKNEETVIMENKASL